MIKGNTYTRFGSDQLSGKSGRGPAVYALLAIPALVALGVGGSIAIGHYGFEHLASMFHHSSGGHVGDTISRSLSSGMTSLPPWDPGNLPLHSNLFGQKHRSRQPRPPSKGTKR